MPVVMVLRNHVANGVVQKVGSTYSTSDSQASERARVGLVRFVDSVDSPPPGLVNKVEYAMYAPRQFRIPESGSEAVQELDLDDLSVPLLEVIRKSGSWWFFNDDSKVLGQVAAAEKLGISVEDFVRDHASRFS